MIYRHSTLTFWAHIWMNQPKIEIITEFLNNTYKFFDWLLLFQSIFLSVWFRSTSNYQSQIEEKSTNFRLVSWLNNYNWLNCSNGVFQIVFLCALFRAFFYEFQFFQQLKFTFRVLSNAWLWVNVWIFVSLLRWLGFFPSSVFGIVRVEGNKQQSQTRAKWIFGVHKVQVVGINNEHKQNPMKYKQSTKSSNVEHREHTIRKSYCE